MTEANQAGSTQRLVDNNRSILPMAGFYSQRHQDALISIEQGVTSLANRTFAAPGDAIAAEIHIFAGAAVYRHGEHDEADDVTVADRFAGDGETVSFQVPTEGSVIINSVDTASSALGGTVELSLTWILARDSG